MSCVCWITGLSCSGKSTLAFTLKETLKEKISNLVLLDGDSVRSFFGDNLGYKKADRIRQIKRLQKISRMLYNQGSFVIVAALYSDEDLLDWNRKNISSYYEILMEASFDVLSKRDELGLYNSDLPIKNVVGVDIEWNAPLNPDMVINTSNDPNVKKLAVKAVENMKARNLI